MVQAKVNARRAIFFLSYFGQDRELIYGMAASFGIHLEVLDLLARAAGRAILLAIVFSNVG